MSKITLFFQLFDKVRQLRPTFQEKIIGIAGDCALPGLGLTQQDHCTLITNVNIVFHSAATVNFNERLSLSLKINVRGTHAIVMLCHEMKHLQALIHISTAYSNPHVKPVIEEKFYPAPVISGTNALKLLDSKQENVLDVLSESLIKPFPNTYCFTKQLAEDLIKQEACGLPVVIFRPAISKLVV